MADYGKYCPISLGAEVLADRWTPLILRELIMGNSCGGCTATSPSTASRNDG